MGKPLLYRIQPSRDYWYSSATPSSRLYTPNSTDIRLSCTQALVSGEPNGKVPFCVEVMTSGQGTARTPAVLRLHVRCQMSQAYLYLDSVSTARRTTVLYGGNPLPARIFTDVPEKLCSEDISWTLGDARAYALHLHFSLFVISTSPYFDLDYVASANCSSSSISRCPTKVPVNRICAMRTRAVGNSPLGML